MSATRSHPLSDPVARFYEGNSSAVCHVMLSSNRISGLDHYRTAFGDLRRRIDAAVSRRGPCITRVRGCVDGDFSSFKAAAEAAKTGTRTTSSKIERRACRIIGLCLQAVIDIDTFLLSDPPPVINICEIVSAWQLHPRSCSLTDLRIHHLIEMHYC